MAAAEQAMLRAEKAIHRHTTAATDASTRKTEESPRVPPPPPPEGAPSSGATGAPGVAGVNSKPVDVPPPVPVRSASAGSTWRGPRPDVQRDDVVTPEEPKEACDSDGRTQTSIASSTRDAWAQGAAPVPPPTTRPVPPVAGVAAATASACTVPTSPASAASATPAATSPAGGGKVPSPVFGDATASVDATTAAAVADVVGDGNGWLKELRAQLKTDDAKVEEESAESLSSEPSPTTPTPV